MPLTLIPFPNESEIRIGGETKEQRIERESAADLEAVEATIRGLYLQRLRLQETRARAGQLRSRFEGMHGRLDALRKSPEDMTFEEAEQLRAAVHATGQELLQVTPEAEQAAADLLTINAEIQSAEAERDDVRKNVHRRKLIVRLERLIVEGWTITGQEELDALVRQARENGWPTQDVGVHLELAPQPPSRTPISASESVQTYLKVRLSQLDERYAATLDPDDPARRKFEVSKRGGGVSAPALRWG